VWPAALGLDRSAPLRADVREVPPSSTPYQPPFAANTTMDGER
jgi:hypothetical protein